MAHHLSSSNDYGLPKPIIGWIVKHATKNFWRVADWYDLDDLVQDGLLCAYKCKDRYGEPGVDIDPPHFMSLVKTTFHRHIAELLRHSRGEQEITYRIGDAAGEMTETDFLDRKAEPVEPMQDLVALIAGMPEALRKAVMLYINDPRKLRRRSRLDGDEETEAQLLKRLVGFPVRLDFETELRSYLWEAEMLPS